MPPILALNGERDAGMIGRMTVNRFAISLCLALHTCIAAPVHYGQLPFTFERDQGQADPTIRFLARGRQYTATIADDGLRLRLKAAPDRVVHFQLTAANRNARLDAPDKLPDISNYLIGDDPRRWIYGVPQYGKSGSAASIPAFDVAYHGDQGQLEHDFLVAPGAHPDILTINQQANEQSRSLLTGRQMKVFLAVDPRRRGSKLARNWKVV